MLARPAHPAAQLVEVAGPHPRGPGLVTAFGEVGDPGERGLLPVDHAVDDACGATEPVRLGEGVDPRRPVGRSGEAVPSPALSSARNGANVSTA